MADVSEDEIVRARRAQPGPLARVRPLPARRAVTGRGHRFGVFRAVQRPVYDDLMAGQLDKARERPQPPADLAGLLTGSDPWTVD